MTLLSAPQHKAAPVRVAGGSGPRRFTVRAGEGLEVITVDGGQAGVLAAPAGVLRAIAPDQPAPQEGEGEALYTLFTADEQAGTGYRFDVLADGEIVLDLPAEDMMPDQSNAPGAYDLHFTPSPRGCGRLPEPLGPIAQDVRVPAATAVCYRVRKGEYIQIIDVDGRQCSDFLAFDAEALSRGQEYGLDATATRTVQGHALPVPGLHGRFLDSRLQPLVEVVQDTVGRHDAFLLACTAKYYDETGYPGHANCSDNFNAILVEEGLAPRSGWPAINFFFNTQVQDCGAITSAEPWSRAGDYVLLRALTDLVCASSSCADDVTEANGWQPTDIHVRVYDRDSAISSGVAHRMTPEAPAIMTRQSGFHSDLAAQGAQYVEYKGFWLPARFEGYGAVAEYWACRTRACVMDLSALRKFEITGPDALALLQLAATRDIRKLAVGQVVYTALCYPHGGMLDDATVFRLAPQAFRLVCGDEYCGQWLRAVAAEHGLHAFVRPSTDQLHNLSVQGPQSRAILQPLIWTPPTQPDIAALKWFRFTIGRVGGPSGVPVLVSRTGYTGELGYEIWCHPRHAHAVWEAVWAAGQPEGLVPLGLDALDWLRIEAGLAFAAYEFCSETDPFEAGIGFAVPASKTDEFIGSQALAQRRLAPQRKLVGLESLSNEHLSHGDAVYDGRARVGSITSACLSPVLGKSIALARVDTAVAEPGRMLEIGQLDGLQKRIPVKVTSFPAYDPDKSRVRS